uniref:Uncharacterized protein n=1 Tax=Candidatus Kentrum sp. FM TaxID=2126340 RepID=A0A450W1Q2_9GAMM|nr:MAG: hypothetical protein BECKFM1743C_GA0114222_100084 [Candidatus Kentron sp. FM]VFJ55045.1 MAG: hypothetical protein BECKFM1743A_GA0114220_101412 [Candidatus Kentron sp. FM]VFK10935.1 MAG: hypothetical protein BECKFM1743B_GA0114221_101612 [Candidatus Kentron sp. FM]
MANIFWLGGTGANVAMAFARMQYLGLVPNSGLRHFFIDSPENFGPATMEPGREDINIGVDALKRLGLGESSEPYPIPLTQQSYQTFQQFLAAKPQLKPFYEGIPDYDEILNTPVKDGNYYMPAIAAAMAHAEFIPPDGRLIDNRSIICASSYGGTGAGVAPFLAKHLLKLGHDIKVIYLNHWLVNPAQSDVARITRHNERANIDYMGKLKDNAGGSGQGAQLDWFLFYVTEDWRQQTPPDRPNNTGMEIANPFPYYAANHIAWLVGDGAGGAGQQLKGGIYRLEIDKEGIANNRAFIHAYAHTRLAATCDRELPGDFDFVLALMAPRRGAPRWGLRRLAWDKTAFARLRDMEYTSDGARQQAIRGRIEEENRGSGEGKRKNLLDWTGFRALPFQLPDLNEPIRLISYPSLFASYHYFRDRLQSDTACREAYLALVALVATKQVYVEYDPFVDKMAFGRESRAMPFKLVDAGGLPLGYAAERGLYLWPPQGRIPELRGRLARENLLRRALQQLYERQRDDGGRMLWESNSPLGQALTNWGTTHNAALDTGRKVSINLKFFEELYFAGGGEHIVPERYKPSTLDSREGGTTGRIIFKREGDEFGLAISGPDHNLFVLDDKLLQYVNVLRPGNDRRMPRGEGLRSYLILNYRTLVDLSDLPSPEGGKYEVEILHPRHILADYAFEFPRVEGGARAGSFAPWPLRKGYIGCLEPAGGWHAAGRVNYPAADNGYVDMRPHRIRNWGHVEEVDPLNRDAFLIPLHSTIPLRDAPRDNKPVGETKISKTTYQGYVWPCDAQSKRFLNSWRFYSIMVTCSPGERLLANEITDQPTTREHWFFRHAADGWQPLRDVPSSRGTFMGTCLGEPPEALAFEFTDPVQDFYYGGYFPLPPPETLSPGELKGSLGIDFGTSNTCSAVSTGIAEMETVKMNPSELLYPVFSNQEWERLKDLGFGWVPWLGFESTGRYGGKAEIFPSGLHSLRPEEWEQVNIKQEDDGKLIFYSIGELARGPLEHFTIPGEHIQDLPEYTSYNIKWAGKEKTRIVLWKDFFTVYLLFLSAHLFMGRQFPQNRFTALDINATMPMRFRQSGESSPAELVKFRDLGEAFEKVIQAAAREVQGYTGLKLNYGATFYESIASTQSLASRLTEGEVFVVVDVGGGTTDVAVLKGHRCISSSSFVFAGNNPFGAAFNEKYIQRQLNIGKADDQAVDPMGGKSHLLSDFIRTLANYTALLVGAAIKQTGLRPTKKGKLKLSVCLFGQAWHLAKFDPELVGTKSNRREYRKAIVMKEILEAFNGRVRPELLGKDFPELGENNILIGNDAASSKTGCCMGAINTVSIDKVDEASEVTFLGLSYRGADKEEVPWHALDNGIRIGSYDDIEADALCPGLMIAKGTLGNRLINNDRWTTLTNPGGPIRNRRVQRNYLEYFLEAEVGGFTRTDDTNPVTFHDDLVKWKDEDSMGADEEGERITMDLPPTAH